MKEKTYLFGSKPPIKIKRWYKKLTTNDKRFLWGFVGLFILSLSISLLISTIRTYNSDLSLQECNQLRADDVRFYLEMQEENNILAFIYAFQFPFKLLIGAVAIGWVLHGVGFRVAG